MRVGIGDFISYKFGSTEFIGIVVKLTNATSAGWGGSSQPDFTMKMLELDGSIADWDVWPSDEIIIHSAAG